MKQRGQEEQYEAVVHEYSLLLTGQLEVQRRHYEERLAELDRTHKRHLFELEQVTLTLTLTLALALTPTLTPTFTLTLTLALTLTLTLTLVATVEYNT